MLARGERSSDEQRHARAHEQNHQAQSAPERFRVIFFCAAMHQPSCRQHLRVSRRPKILFETSWPSRYDVPSADVRAELLVAGSTKSRYSRKGPASCWHVRLGDCLLDDLAWSHPGPQNDGEPVADLPCFSKERVDFELDGEATERPDTRIIDRGRESGVWE
jgi:uncharacterized protein (DUF427 family)